VNWVIPWTTLHPGSPKLFMEPQPTSNLGSCMTHARTAYVPDAVAAHWATPLESTEMAGGGYPLYSPSPYGLWFAFGLPQDRVNYPVMGNRIDGQSLLRQAKEEFASAL
jgi:hypothetical protein